MTPDEARQLIRLDGSFSAEELEETFRRRSQEMESKIERAPTPGLKEKYRRTLSQLEEAWEVLSGQNSSPGDLNFPTLQPTLIAQLPENLPVTVEKTASAKEPPVALRKTNLGLIVTIGLLIVSAASVLGYWGYWIPSQEAQEAKKFAEQAQEKDTQADQAAQETQANAAHSSEALASAKSSANNDASSLAQKVDQDVRRAEEDFKKAKELGVQSRREVVLGLEMSSYQQAFHRACYTARAARQHRCR